MADVGTPTFDPRFMPSYGDVNTDTNKASPFWGGLGAGLHGLLGLGSSAIQGVANLEGADKVADVARGWAATQNRIADRIRPDLDIAPWQQGGASVLPWAEYQLGKLAPTLAGYAGATLAAPEAAIPTAIARGLPSILGGVAADATPEAAAAAGKFVLGGGLFGGTTGFGQAIQSADQKPGGATQGDAAQALAESPLYAAAGILTPGFLKGALGATEGKGLIKAASQIATKGLEGSAVGAFQSGTTTALDQTFRPDLTARDKMNNIVEATAAGAAVGGLAGGLAGGLSRMRSLKRVDANDVTTDALDQATAAVDPATQQKLLSSTVYGDTAGRASPDANALTNGAGLIDYNTIANPKEGSLRWAKPYEQGSPAPFAAAPTIELQKISQVAENYLAGLPEDHKFTERDAKVRNQLALITEELQRRNPIETSNGAETAPTGAVEPGGVTAPAPVKTFKDTVAELTKGLRLPGRVLADIAGAKDANDLLSKVHDQIFQQQDERPTVQKLAQRLGLLDAELQPTDVAQALGTRKADQQAAAAPVDEAFQQKWDALTVGKNLPEDDVVRDLPRPANEQEAQRTVYTALTADRGEMSNRLEQIAQEVGLLGQDKKPTDLFVNMAKQDIPLHESTTAAMDKGFKGAEVSQFDRGARTPVDEAAPKFDNLREALAFVKGREWANPDTLSAPETRRIIKEYNLGDHFEAGQEIPQEQRGQRDLNTMVDEKYPPTKFPTENAQLKGLVREGDDQAAVDEAARYMRTGHGALVTPPAPVRPRDPNVRPTIYGDTITPDPALSGRTAADIVQSDAAQKQDAARAGRAGRVLTDRQAIVQYELKESLKLALRNEDVKPGQYMHLRQALDAGDNDKVREALSKLGVSPYMHVNGKDITTGRDRVAAADLLDRQNNSGGGAQTLMAHLKDLGGPIGNMAARFEKYVPADVKVDIKTPDEMRQMFRDVMGYDIRKGIPVGQYNRNTRTITLSTEMDHPAVALHEIVHSITDGHIDNKTPIGREMTAMYNKFKNSGPASDYAFTDAKEFMAEFLSRQQVRDYVKNAQPTVFQKVWNALRKMLGMPAKDYVERLLKLAERAGAELIGRSDFNAPPIVNKLTSERIKDIADAADHLVQRDGALGVARRTSLGWATVHDISQFWGKWFKPETYGEAFKGMANPVEAYEGHLGQKQSIVARMAQMGTNARDAVQHLLRVDRVAGETLVRLTRLSEFGIDPTKDWDHQIDRVRNSGNEALKALHADSYKLYNDKLLRGGHAGVYQNLRDVNDTQMLAQIAVTLHSQVAADSAAAQLAHFATGPMDRFLDAQNNQDFSPATARKWWAGELQAQLNVLDDHFRAAHRAVEQLGDSTKENRQKGEILKSLEPLQLRAKSIKQTVAQLDEAPYFHLGRFGNYFVGWHVTSQEALGKVADVLEAEGFRGVISRESEKVNTYMRVESQRQQADLLAAIEKFNTDNPGLIEPGHTVSGARTAETVRTSMADQWFNRMVEDIKANEDIPEDVKKASIDSLRQTALDLMPENSISRVMTHREGVPGYDPDMMRAFEHRQNVGINALAGYVIAPKVSRAFTDMRTLEKAAQEAHSSEVSIAQRNGMTNVIDELSRRESERPTWPQSKFLDQMRAINHAWFLGGSISYGLVNLSQLGATLLPELGSRHGFVKTATMMGKVTPDVIKITRAIWQEGREVSLSRAMDAVVTRGVLDKAGIDPKMAEFIMRVANSGELDIGGPSRELMRAAAGQNSGGVNATLRYASAIGYYTETASRLVAALSSYHLDNIKDPEAAAARAVYVLKETMWDYSQANQGREFGKMGVLGRFTPLATAFMQYTAQLTGKLYRETYEAIKGETPAERAEARRFLLQHATGMTILAGSLGLPMVSALAATVDRLKDEFDGDGKPSDVRAAWRDLLSDTFGKDVGEVLSRGATRAAGFDISTRVGEQDILPFSRFIADRRSFKDSIKDMQSRSWGAPTSMLANALLGGEKISNGDFLGGMQRMLPNALAAPTKAFQMSKDGFVDANGRVLPMKPSTANIVTQLMGFSPSVSAEYSEARQDQAVRKGQLTRQATTLRNSLVQSIIDKDHDTARGALDQIKQFNEANPAMAIKGGDIEGALRRQATAAAIAKATGTPLGVAPQDIDAQRLTRYANVAYQPQ